MKILLVGAGGYGIRYLKLLLNNQVPHVVFEGIVEKFSCPMQEEVQVAGVPVYETLEAFYAEHTADLALISTPSFLHREQSIYCVRQGTHVLCEKPAAPTVEEVEEMVRAEKETGKFIAIGFQQSFADETQALKQDILDGVLGKPISMKAMLTSPRTFDYYARGGGYAGRISKDGHMILDSVASNACAHYVHNMLFLLGESMNTSAVPCKVAGECLRANKIENFDTCTLKLTLPGGVPVYFAASHATEGVVPYTFCFQFENAVVRKEADGTMAAHFKDGTVKNYGNPSRFDVEKKYADCVAAAKNGTRPICTAETTLAHTTLINEIYRSIPTTDFTEEAKVYCEDRVYVPGLDEKLRRAYEATCLLSEV